MSRAGATPSAAASSRRSVARSAGKTAGCFVMWTGRQCNATRLRPSSPINISKSSELSAHLRRRVVTPGAMLTERPSSRKAPVAEAENIPPPPRRGGRPSKPVDAAGRAQTSSAPSPTTWIPEDATPCGEGHRSVESQYQDALRALDADRETLRREVERVIAADAAREGEHATLRDRIAELERELEDARAAAADPNDDDDRRQRQPATLAMVRRLRQELSEARAAAAEAARAQVDKIQTSFSGSPDETELSAIRVEIDRTRAEMAAALGEVSDAAKDRDDALEEVRVELGVLQAERMRLIARVDSVGKNLPGKGKKLPPPSSESPSQGSTADAGVLRARVRDLEASNASLLLDAERFESLRVETRALAETIATDAKQSAEAEDAMRREIRTVKSELKLAQRELEKERKRREDAEGAAERERRNAEEATAAKSQIQIQKPKQNQKPNRPDPEAPPTSPTSDRTSGTRSRSFAGRSKRWTRWRRRCTRGAARWRRRGRISSARGSTARRRRPASSIDCASSWSVSTARPARTS